MQRRCVIFLVAAFAFAINGYAADSWNVFHCSPIVTAEATGIRILNEHGDELFRVCQNGTLLPQTGFANVTSDQHRDFLFVTKVGAKMCEATLYRKSGAHYVRVGGWSGWIFVRKRGKTAPYTRFPDTPDNIKSFVETLCRRSTRSWTKPEHKAEHNN